MNNLREIKTKNKNGCMVCNSKEIKHLYTSCAMMHSSRKKFNFFICKMCKLVFLDPRPSLVELMNYYTDSYLPYRGPSAWGRYQKFATLSQKRLDERRLKILKEHSSPKRVKSILDIGCGNPTFLETCSRFFKSSLHGIDFSDNGWKKEQDRFKNLNLKVGTIDDIEANLSPDIISLWHFLEHDYYPNKTLSKLALISNPETKLFIEVPNYESISRKKYKENWAGFHTPRHTFIFSPKNIEMLLNKNGWKVDLIDLKGTLNSYILNWMSEMEIQGLDWKNSMENQFWNFVLNLVKYKLKHIFTKESEGVMTVVARKFQNKLTYI